MFDGVFIMSNECCLYFEETVTQWSAGLWQLEMPRFHLILLVWYFIDWVLFTIFTTTQEYHIGRRIEEITIKITVVTVQRQTLCLFDEVRKVLSLQIRH